ncbi:MAG: PAS domain S-box protein [Alphaproteobacteria bacterium]|nr:MAG: PAS domain S-box protein [Alphaproteobacteria bacterium]
MQSNLPQLFGDLAAGENRLLKRLSLVFAGLICLALFLLVYFSSEGIRTLDHVDNKNDVKIVGSLLRDRQNIMASLLRDYAEWNDAYRALYEKEDLKFADENISYNVTNNYSINGATVVRFDKSIFVQYEAGKRVKNPHLEPFVERLVDLLLEDFRNRHGKPLDRSRISFAEENGQLLMVSANFIAGLDDEKGVPDPLPKNPSMLVFVRKLDKAALQEWAQVYNISDMNYQPHSVAFNPVKLHEAKKFYLQLKDIDGNELGIITWQPNLSSSLILKEFIPNLVVVLVILLGFGSAFFVYIRRAFAHQYEWTKKINSSREFLQLIFDTDPTHIQVRNKEGKIFFCNQAAASRYGRSPAQVLYHSILELDKNTDRAYMIYEDDLKVIVGQREMAQEEIWIATDGSEKIYYTLRKPIVGIGGETMVLAVSSDITEQKKMMLELEKAKSKAEDASKAKTDFLATISHEIRTPMNGILGFSQLLSDTKLTDEQDDYIKVIQNSSKSLLNIINDILDMSKIESGRLRLESILLNPNAIIDSVIGLTMPMAKEKNLTIVKEVIGSVPDYVLGDPTRLSQILLNIVSNAIKFTEKGGITIRVQNMGHEKKFTKIKFEIIDTGIGIEPKILGKLFEKFTQADSSISRKYGGTGLGLAIARELTELMGGQIGVQSAPGKGAHFWFTVSLNNAS